MKVEELLIYGKKYCHSAHAKLLLADLLALNSLELLLHLDDEIPEDKVLIYKQKINALKDNRPLQYVQGYVNFYGNRFIINEDVLIPRFETEELVENTIYYINKYFKDTVDIIDLGCGSGVIGLTLKSKILNSNVDLLDISEKALEVSRINSNNLNLDVNLIKNDMLNNIQKKYDIIISNPPYIKKNEEIEEIVKNNEPHLALYAGTDGLDCYRKILSTVMNNVKDKFIIALEIGATQKDDIIKVINSYLDNVIIEVKKDLQGRDRMCFIFSDNLF